jgi:sigma-E factor negative regulatory protein RseC
LIEQGVVRSVAGEMATIEVLPASPESCATCGGCAEVSTGRILEIRSTPGLRPGQRVELEVQGAGGLGPAAVVFLLPVVAILIGAVSGNLVVSQYPHLGVSQTLGGFLGAVVLLVPALVALRHYDRAYGKRGARVRILRRWD